MVVYEISERKDIIVYKERKKNAESFLIEPTLVVTTIKDI